MKSIVPATFPIPEGTEIFTRQRVGKQGGGRPDVWPSMQWPEDEYAPANCLFVEHDGDTVTLPRAQVEQALALIDDMSRHVGKMALQDYAAFNEVPTNLRRALG